MCDRGHCWRRSQSCRYGHTSSQISDSPNQAWNLRLGSYSLACLLPSKDAEKAKTTTIEIPPAKEVVQPTATEDAATLNFSYEGTAPVLQRQVSTSVHTPDNHDNRGDCPNKIGYHDRKYCTSRTPMTVSTSSPAFLRTQRSLVAVMGVHGQAIASRRSQRTI